MDDDPFAGLEQLYALLVGQADEAPEDAGAAAGGAMVEAAGASLLLVGLDVEVVGAAHGFKHAIDDGAGLLGVFIPRVSGGCRWLLRRSRRSGALRGAEYRKQEYEGE